MLKQLKREKRLEDEATRKRSQREEQRNVETIEEREERLINDAQRKTKERTATHSESEFPPTISAEMIQNSVADFIKATSGATLKEVFCGVCAVRCTEFEVCDIDEIPSRELLLKDANLDVKNLPEYEIRWC